MSSVMNSGDLGARELIEKLQVVLNFLDENDLAIPAIKIEEAINALKQVESDKSEVMKRNS